MKKKLNCEVHYGHTEGVLIEDDENVDILNEGTEFEVVSTNTDVSCMSGVCVEVLSDWGETYYLDSGLLD